MVADSPSPSRSMKPVSTGPLSAVSTGSVVEPVPVSCTAVSA